MVCSSCVVREDLANTGTAGHVSLGSAGAATFLLGSLISMPRRMVRLPSLLRLWACPRSSQWFALMPRRFSWVGWMISMPRCLLRSRWWAGLRAS